MQLFELIPIVLLSPLIMSDVLKIQRLLFEHRTAHHRTTAPLAVRARRRVGASFRKMYAAERRRGIKQIIIRSNLSNMLYIIIIYYNI